MSEPTIAELDRLIEYLELALKVSEVNARATQALLEHERQLSARLRCQFVNCRMRVEHEDPELAQRVFQEVPLASDM